MTAKEGTVYEADRYLPTVYPGEEPFWDGFRDHEIRLQVCDRCGRAWFPIGPVCPFCLSDAFTWKPMSGRGTISTFVVFHKAWAPWLESRVPYAVVQVELAEGPRLTTNLMGVPAAETRIGMPVKACYEQVADDVVLLQFEPDDTGGHG
jgi:uncharacterized protein